MAAVRFEGVGKAFAGQPVLEDFTLTVDDGELIAVLGPSGCGKSTLLRVTAGLESLTGGTIRLGERRIDTLPAAARDVAMVFQSYALYPHLRVRDNIEFPLRMRGMDRAARRRRAETVAGLLDVGAVLDRRPAELSGGQRQRVALARALVREPALFLLDEPLSNLDARLRLSVRQYIREVQRRVAVTTLYVTHDQVEAMTLGDRVVVMNGGRIQQVDRPVAVYERPANTFVAGFLGSPPMNLLPGTYDDGHLRVGDQRIPLPERLRSSLAAIDGALVVGIRPEAFVPASAAPALVARPLTEGHEILGSETLVRARIGDLAVVARLPGVVRSLVETLDAPLAALHFFGAADGRRVDGHAPP